MLKGMTNMYINCDKGFVIWPKLIIYSGDVRSSDCGLYILIVNLEQQKNISRRNG
jgi:hypothetical protein